jgi:hypothetical protein
LKGYAGSNLDAGSGSDGQHLMQARGGGARLLERFPAAARGSGSPDFTDSSAPVANKARVCVREGQRDVCNPPRALAGLGEARGHGCDHGGGSAWWSPPACARACGSGHRGGRKRGQARAWCKGKPKQGDEAAVQSCRGLAPVEQRWQNAGVRGLASRVGYGLPDLSQQEEQDHGVLTEGSDRPERQRRVVGGEV